MQNQEGLELEVGGWYWVVGCGPMQIEELPGRLLNPNRVTWFLDRYPVKTSVTLLTAGRLRYWADPEDLTRQMTPETWDTWIEEHLRRSMSALRPAGE